MILQPKALAERGFASAQLGDPRRARRAVTRAAALFDNPAAAFWKAQAGLGGYLGRKRDGPPGWKTVWRGWLHVQAVLIGVHLAYELGP